jgi:hypothetical protein
MGVVQSIGALLGGGLRELKRQEVQKPSSMICCVLVVLPQPTLHTRTTRMPLFVQIGASQHGNWLYSSQQALKVCVQLL